MVKLWGQEMKSLFVRLSEKGNSVHKMCEMYKSIDIFELDNTSYFYGQLVNDYEQKVDMSTFLSLWLFLIFNKKLSLPIFKDKHNGYRITKFMWLRFKMYCLNNKKDVTHNSAKGVPHKVIVDRERMYVKTSICRSVYVWEIKQNVWSFEYSNEFRIRILCSVRRSKPRNHDLRG